MEAVDILYPFMFSDTGACVEGPYEYGKVVCKEGEVVIDAGANIGMFSCCAASKECKVFAFEPTEKTREYLRQNVELYKKGAVEILEYALSDGKRTACFAVNDNGESSKNRLSENAIECSHLEEVFTTSIDKLVEENIVQRVDFIKADIEGAERKMLVGARKTLEKFAPKLSICTYHLPDDKEVLTNIILQANPKYKIIYAWKKLYAYVPKNEEN